jgi:hypothetical protein
LAKILRVAANVIKAEDVVNGLVDVPMEDAKRVDGFDTF